MRFIDSNKIGKKNLIFLGKPKNNKFSDKYDEEEKKESNDKGKFFFKN